MQKEEGHCHAVVSFFALQRPSHKQTSNGTDLPVLVQHTEKPLRRNQRTGGQNRRDVTGLRGHPQTLNDISRSAGRNALTNITLHQHSDSRKQAKIHLNRAASPLEVEVRFIGVDPHDCIHNNINRFRSRFRNMQQNDVTEGGLEVIASTLFGK